MHDGEVFSLCTSVFLSIHISWLIRFWWCFASSYHKMWQ